MLAALVILFILKLRFPRGTPISAVIQRRYGRQGITLFRRLEKTTLKLKKCECDLLFLSKCKAYETLPKFLYFKLYKKNLLNSKLYRKWQFKLLNIEINAKQRNIKRLKELKTKLSDDLRSLTSFLDYYYLISFITKIIHKTIAIIKKTQERKLSNLGVNNSLKPLDPNKVIFNYSSRLLTPKEESLLAFGLNFKLPHFKIDYFKYFLAFENLYQVLRKQDAYREDQQPPLNSTLQSIAFKAFYNFKPYKVFSPIFSKSDINILRNLSKDKSLVICRPDKGLGVVLLDKNDYVNKMYNILNDTSKFKKIENTDPLLYTLRNEDKVNYRIRKLKKEGTISENLATELSVSGTNPGTMYGLPKVHKTDMPLRPILSANNTSSYNLSKFLVPKLNHLTTNEFTLKNSYEFSNFITTIPNSNNYVMCSFDIVSLFTNIPLDETLNICLNQLFPNEDSVYEGFDKSQFKSLLELATKNTFFLFNGALYEQVDGVAMGSPCGPTLANTFLCHFERIWLEECPAEFRPIIYKRYVDDTFLLFKDVGHIDLFLTYVNSKHPNIKFTKEIEEDMKLSFLDVTVTRTNNSFETSIFRKKTFTGLGSHYLSIEPILYKINAIRTLIFRAYNLSSSYLNFSNEINFLKNYFHCNGFPGDTFYKYVRLFLSKIYHPTPVITTVKKHTIYVAFPYFGYISDILREEIRICVERLYPQINLKLAFKNSFSVGSFFRHKDPMPISLCSNVIYTYSCALCNECYTGSTQRQLQCRIAEHLGISVRTGLPLSRKSYSAIYDHREEKDHPINKKNFKIVGRSFNVSNLRLLESLYILKNGPKMNAGLPVELSVVC